MSNERFSSIPDIRRAINDTYYAAKKFDAPYMVNCPDGFEGITATEMYALGMSILDCLDVAKAYELMSGMTSSGDGNYYDKLIGEPQHLETYKALDLVLRQKERTRVNFALDLGGATGMCGVLMSQVADHVMVTDLSPGLLTHATEFLSSAGRARTFETRVMNVISIDLPNDSVDIAASNAVTHYLTFEEKMAFYRGVHRVLKPGGRYYEPQQEKPDEMSMYTVSPRGMLAKHVVSALLATRGDTVIQDQKLGLPNPEQFGFETLSVVYQREPFIKQIMQLTKL